MSFSVKPLLLSTLVLAGGAALHGERPLIVASLDPILKEGSYNNDATPPWVLTVRDGKFWITDPKGKVALKRGREGAIARDYESHDTWLELDRNGTLVLWETRKNSLNDTYKKWSNWSETSPGKGIKAVLFQDDGTIKYVPR